MNNKIKHENVDFLFDCILALETVEECYDFFEDLCTFPEIRAMAQRAVVAKMLTEKTVYSTIVSQTGASTATISRVNRSLQFGNGAYTTVFERLNKADDE